MPFNFISHGYFSPYSGKPDTFPLPEQMNKSSSGIFLFVSFSAKWWNTHKLQEKIGNRELPSRAFMFYCLVYSLVYFSGSSLYVLRLFFPASGYCSHKKEIEGRGRWHRRGRKDYAANDPLYKTVSLRVLLYGNLSLFQEHFVVINSSLKNNNAQFVAIPLVPTREINSITIRE